MKGACDCRGSKLTLGRADLGTHNLNREIKDAVTHLQERRRRLIRELRNIQKLHARRAYGECFYCSDVISALLRYYVVEE